MQVIDLFAGFGGWSTGAKMAGAQVLWAANHWPEAVNWHMRNHPDTEHVCQDLHQADWSRVPSHDVLLASPCCHGHSPARGKPADNPQHDASRSTAWAVVTAAEYHRPEVVIVENVPHFLEWSLYPAWNMAMEALGYVGSSHVVDCADLGIPQNRIRLFAIYTRSKAPLFEKLPAHLLLPEHQHRTARSFVDFDSGRWSLVEKPGRAKNTLDRVRNGRKQFGDRFVMPYYGNGSGKTGRSLDRPIGTIVTRARWAVVDGPYMRMLTPEENMAAQTFPADTQRPRSGKATIHLTGNAVPPEAGCRIIQAVKAAA